MLKKIIISSLVVSSLAIGLIALADNTNTNTSTSSLTPLTSALPAQPMMLQVGPNGKATLRGTIDAIPNSSSLTVKGWGGDWTINISASTILTPNDITQFKVGDFVGVQGTVSQTASWTIDAAMVRDRVQGDQQGKEKGPISQGQHENDGQQNKEGQTNPPPQGSQNPGIQQQIQSILDQIKKIQAQINTQPGQ